MPRSGAFFFAQDREARLTAQPFDKGEVPPCEPLHATLPRELLGRLLELGVTREPIWTSLPLPGLSAGASVAGRRRGGELLSERACRAWRGVDVLLRAEDARSLTALRTMADASGSCQRGSMSALQLGPGNSSPHAPSSCPNCDLKSRSESLCLGVRGGFSDSADARGVRCRTNASCGRRAALHSASRLPSSTAGTGYFCANAAAAARFAAA